MTEPNRRFDPDASDDEVLLRQVRAALTPMPPVDRRAIADILAAVAARKPTRWQRFRTHLDYTVEQWRYATSPLVRGSALAAAALMLGFVARGAFLRDATVSAGGVPTVAATAPVRTDAPAGVGLRAVDGASDAASQLVTVQFLLDAREVPTASRVSVVGDFNEWNPTATPLVLDGGVWSVTLPTTPGRHVYAFVVDGERWLADPRAPRATDSDFGRPGSVMLVQTP